MTAPAPLVGVTDLASWVEESIPEEDPRAELVLRGASALVREETGKTWGTDAEPLPESLWFVVLQAAARAWLNPEGFTDERLAEWSGKRGAETADGVYLTESEKRACSRFTAAPRARRGIGIVTTTRGEGVPLETYVPVVGSDEPLPVSPPRRW